MKYIRTENGIWELDDLGCVHHPYNNMLIHKSYLEIIKQADTIEELIDEWVVVMKSHKETPMLVYWFSTSKKHKDDVVYGAIWTDKGLIYVAKMNDKGELELL